MVTDSAALVLFAIRSGLRLGQQVRQAYIESTQRRELVLPLPKFFGEVDANDQAQWFLSGDGQTYRSRSPRLDKILQRFSEQKPLAPDEVADLKEFYRDYRTLFLAENGLLPPESDRDGDPRLPAQDVLAWVTVRQWARGTDPNPSALQRVAGTFIEIGVDYFNSMPGALRQNSAWGKALSGFFKAMDQVHFSEERLEDLPARLLVAALETIEKEPALLSGDPRVQELVQVTALALSQNVATRLDQIAAGDLPNRRRVQDWAELAFRSVLGSAGKLVVAQPEKFLGVQDAAHGALVSNVGNAVLDVILDEPDQRLDQVFSRENLDTVIQAALITLGEHPEILVQTRNQGLKQLLSQTARELSQFDTLLNPDVLPEMLRIVLVKTGENLDLLWPDLKKKPETNLALTAAKATLAALSEPIPGVRWKLRFTRDHLVRISNSVIDELVANPQWLLEQAGETSETLEEILRAALKVLAQRGDERISPDTGLILLEEVIRAAVLRREWIERIPETNQARIVEALDSLLSAVFARNLDPKAAWQLIRAPVLAGLTSATLRLLSQTRLAPEVIALLDTVLAQEIEALESGQPFALPAFENRLRAALQLP